MFRIRTLLSYTALGISLVQAKYHIFSRETSRDAASQAVLYSVNLPVDHFGSNTDTFTNRYWVNDEFYKDGGPVIFFDNGETNASISLPFITPGQGADAMPDLAKRFGALLILWEHRYYGESLPTPKTSLQTVDDYANYYQYLTVEQALEDVAVFAKNFSLPTHPGKDFRPNSTPWIFVGGSYPGVRAAWMRLRNPEVIYASLSSSGPVELQEDFWQYYVAVERKLAATPGYGGCLNDTIAFAQWATQVVEQKDVSAAESFLSAASLNHTASQSDTSDAWLIREAEFVGVFGAPIKDFQTFGLREGSMGFYCNNLVSSNYTGDTNATTLDLKDGIVAYYGLSYSLKIYAAVVHELLTLETQNGNNAELAPDSNPNLDSMSWAWQTCTELGFFQISNTTRPTNIVPGFVDLNWWIQFNCISQFGTSTGNGPNTAPLDTKYGGWHPANSTNIFFVNGQFDPWRALSVASDIDPSMPANTLTTTIPASGQSLANGAIFGFLVENGQHTSDLNYNLTAVATNTTTPDSSDESAAVAHEIFASALSSWLPAFTPFAAASPPVTGLGTATVTAAATSTATGAAATTKPAHSGTASSGHVWKESVWAVVVVALGIAVLV